MNGIGGIGGWELMLVAVIAMLVLGPEHMVKHAYRFGRWARKFSGYWQEAVAAFREQIKDIEEEAVGDGADLPNLNELRDLAAELRLDDELTGASRQAAPGDVPSREPDIDLAEGDVADETANDDHKTVTKQAASYSAWRRPK